jgi:hypothetical protein
MPGSDASQYTRFKKYVAVQSGDTQASDPKSVNRLTQYVSRVTNLSSTKEFLSSLRKEALDYSGYITFNSNLLNVVFSIRSTIRMFPIVTNDNGHSITELIFAGVGSAPGGFEYQIDVSPRINCTIAGISTASVLLFDNQDLTSLDISGISNLITLSCDSNLLTSIDVSNQRLLTSLSCSSNNFTQSKVDNILRTLPTRVASDAATCLILTQNNGSMNNTVFPPFWIIG